MKIICFGDSNTYGYDPRSYFGSRYEKVSRWTDILAAKTGWEVQNNGMNGREIPHWETVFSEATDLLIIMLGTNDLLQGNTAEAVTNQMSAFVEQLNITRDRILLIAPPPFALGEWVQDPKLIDASVALAKSYRNLALEMGIGFADAGSWGIELCFDGVHFTESGHRAFAEGLYHFIGGISHDCD